MQSLMVSKILLLEPKKLGNDPSGSPIALLCTMSKTLKLLIKNCFEWIVEKRGLLAKSRYGFRKGVSATDRLSIFVPDTWIGLPKQEHVVGVILYNTICV